jgi:protein arginine kinase activator
MLCDVCREREHVVSLTTTENGVVGLVHLCEKCAAERGIETTSAEAAHPLGSFLQAVEAQGRSAQADAIRCSFCQTSLRDFRASGRLGCAQCYGAFEQTLRELLRRVHGNSRHVGRAYLPPHPDVMERASTLGELRDRLRRAIETEQFELAASLRDQIRVME